MIVDILSKEKFWEKQKKFAPQLDDFELKKEYENYLINSFHNSIHFLIKETETIKEHDFINSFILILEQCKRCCKYDDLEHFVDIANYAKEILYLQYCILKNRLNAVNASYLFSKVTLICDYITELHDFLNDYFLNEE